MAIKRIILWRHGRTSWNVERRFQGQTDIPLDEVGLEQAQRAADVLVDYLGGRSVHMVSSDLVRAAVTADAVAQRLGLDVERDARLRESDGGSWEGLTMEEIRAVDEARYEQWFVDDNVPAGGAESRLVVGQRAAAAIRDRIERLDDSETEVLLVVAHGGSCKAAMLNLMGVADKSVASGFAVLGNTRFSDLERLNHIPPELATGGWRLAGHNLGVS